MARAGKIGRTRLHQAWYYFSRSIRGNLRFPAPLSEGALEGELDRLAALYEALRRGAGRADAPERPEVSVVIPVHFQEPTDKIVRTMQSLLANREAPPTELVVVINGKASSEELEACEPCRIFRRIGAHILTKSYIEDERYVNIVRPAYIFVPKQIGLQAAQGEVILGTDIDNVFCPEWIRNFKEAFDADPDMLGAYGPVQLYGNTGLIGKTQIVVSTLVKASKIFIDFPPYAGHNHALRASTRDQVPDMYNRIVEDCHECPAIMAHSMHFADRLTSRVRCIPGAVISTYFPKQTESLRLAVKWFWVAAKRNVANWRRVRRHQHDGRRETGTGREA